jgi:hypothetical protein
MKMRVVRLGFMALVISGLVAVAAAQPPPTTSGGSGMALLNLDNTVALHGYDPVAYFTRNRAVKGKKWIVQHLGGSAVSVRLQA